MKTIIFNIWNIEYQLRFIPKENKIYMYIDGEEYIFNTLGLQPKNIDSLYDQFVINGYNYFRDSDSLESAIKTINKKILVIKKMRINGLIKQLSKEEFSNEELMILGRI
jgi:hypothetical protein